MKNIVILVPEHSVLQAIADPQYCFSAVNQFFKTRGMSPVFNIKLAGLRNPVELNGGLFTVHPDTLLHECNTPDLIIIPALSGDLMYAVETNREMIPWIQEQYNKGAEVASLCVGAFLLAATGLLNGKKCSTHWGFYNLFQQHFPETHISPGSIITEENRVYTSGGANSYWNLLLHLTEKYTDRETAVLTSKYFAVDIDRNSQASFALFHGQKEHPDKLILKCQEYIEQNTHQKLSVEELSQYSGLGRRSFERRFKKATHNSVLEYIQRIKIEKAKRSLENSSKNISEIMFEVGYSDSKAFRILFKKISGLNPAEYRTKYNKILTHV